MDIVKRYLIRNRYSIGCREIEYTDETKEYRVLLKDRISKSIISNDHVIAYLLGLNVEHYREIITTNFCNNTEIKNVKIDGQTMFSTKHNVNMAVANLKYCMYKKMLLTRGDESNG